MVREFITAEQYFARLSGRTRFTEKPTPKRPDWSVMPSNIRNIREVVHEDGRPTFEIRIAPEKGKGLFPVSSVGYSHAETQYEMPAEAANEKERIIAERVANLEADYQVAMKVWNEGGKVGAIPTRTLFFESQLVRVVPEEVKRVHDTDGNEGIVVPSGETSYFDYVATRGLNQTQYSHKDMALPLSMCGVLLAKDAEGKDYMIYTVRTTKNESYAGFFHVVGGMMNRPEGSLGSPSLSWLQELREEAGLRPEDIGLENIDGITGFVNDTHWPHPEITHMATLPGQLETHFEKEGVRIRPLRKTDKEVTLRAIPWTPEHLRALVIGEKIEGGDQDLRPWVPSGIANVLLSGKVAFGEAWYKETLQEYTARIGILNKAV